MMLKGKEEVKRFIEEKGIKHFRAEEFVCKHCGKVIIESQLIEILERLREHLRKPVIITNAYRCEGHNRAIGGVPNSAHVRGYAVDVKVLSSQTRYKVIKFLMGEGVSRIGVGEDFIHFDLDPEKPKNVIWHYFRKSHVA